MPPKAPRFDPDTVHHLVQALEDTLARLDARTGRCSLCRDSEAAAFLLRMKDCLARQPGK